MPQSITCSVPSKSAGFIGREASIRTSADVSRLKLLALLSRMLRWTLGVHVFTTRVLIAAGSQQQNVVLALSQMRSASNLSCTALQAGMTSINDFASTYMCQSLPFGGVKESGFDRFAGVEGLRGLCVAKAVAQDRRVILSRLRPNPCLLDSAFSKVQAMATKESFAAARSRAA